MNTINERIAYCIESTGLTKTAFAKRINLSQPHISKIALGYTDPTDRTIADICREFNVNETWLRTGDGEIFNKTPDMLAGKLAKEYGLDELGRRIMSAYLKLDENDRLAVGRLIQNLLKGYGTDQTAILTSSVPAAEIKAGLEQVEAAEETAPPLSTEAGIAAKLAELERQNQELAAKVEAIEEEDALYGLMGGFSTSPLASAGKIEAVERAKNNPAE